MFLFKVGVSRGMIDEEKERERKRRIADGKERERMLGEGMRRVSGRSGRRDVGWS